MATNKERFRQEIARITGDGDGFSVEYPGLDNPETLDALVSFARALDPDRSRPRLRKPRKDGTLVDVETTFGSAKEYLQALRLTYERGFDLLAGTAEEYNDFMHDMVDGELPDYGESIGRTTAKKYQSAARAFFRFCEEPGKADDRPDTQVDWPADDIVVFSDQSEPRYDEADMFEDAEVDALREGCVRSRNSRRDRGFIELLAGTLQRIEAIRTLRVRDIRPDPKDGPPHILLNPEIDGDGDKGAIERTGRFKPIVSDVGPVREWLRNHPLRDPDVRAEHGAPDDFRDCYAFVGDPDHPDTDASRPWDDNAIRNMLTRLAKRTGVDKPVKPHNFRHYAYTKSKDLPIDEDIRRQVFGWRPGSTTGDVTYGHVENRKAGEAFAEAWADAFGEGEDVAGVAEQVVGEAVAGDLSPEVRKALVSELLADEQAVAEIADAAFAAVDG